MAYKLTRERALEFLFENLTASDFENLSKGSEFKESDTTKRLRKELNASLLNDYRDNPAGQLAIEAMRKAINVYCKTHKGFNAEIAINKAVSSKGINAMVDTIDRFARLFNDSVNASLEVEEKKIVVKFRVADAKKLYSICGDLDKTAEYFGVEPVAMRKALEDYGIKVK